MKKENGYFVDNQNNRWSVDLETEESAQQKSKSLINCRDCSGCSCCSGCSSCSDCNGCNGCSDCRYCRYCRYCKGCIDCRNCSGCIDCSDFEENPQRITSPKIGSRNDQTTVYWTDRKVLVVCGCFRGNLNEFEERVKKVHGKNGYAKQYLKLINQAKYNISLWT